MSHQEQASVPTWEVVTFLYLLHYEYFLNNNTKKTSRTNKNKRVLDENNDRIKKTN